MPFRITLFYALPALCVAMPTLPVYIYLPTFYASEVGLGLTAAGAALLFARIFDTVSDPVAGYVSDHLPDKFGRRKPLILIGGAIAGLAMLALVYPPEDAGFWYLTTVAVVLYAGWTFVMVPYTAWGAELSPSYDERTKITAVREGMVLVGILIASAIPAIVAASGSPSAEADGLRTIAWVAVALGIPAFACLAFGVPDKGLPRVAVKLKIEGGLKSAFRSMAANKPFVRLFVAWFVNGLANGFPAVLFLLYMEFGLNIGEAERPSYLLAYFLPAVAFVPLWLWLSQRYEKHKVWCVGMVIASAAFAVVPLLGPDLAWVFLIVCVVTGATLGADVALPPSMQADVVDYDKWKTGHDRTGIFFALWGMATKLALALSVGIAFPLLDFAGFDPEAAAPDAVWLLVVIYALVPVVLKLLAILLVLAYPITRHRHEIIKHRILSNH